MNRFQPKQLDALAWNGHDKLAIDDPRRPIEVIGTSKAVGPKGSERYLDYYVDEVMFPNGNTGLHHRIEVPGGVMLAHTDRKGTIALVENYRHALGRFSVELPSGGLEPPETKMLERANHEEREQIFIEAALREFREEVGWKLGATGVKRLIGGRRGPGVLQGAVGFANQTFNIFHGMGGEPAEQDHDDGEAGMLKTFRHPLDEAAEMIGHEIVDPASSLAIERLNNLHGKTIPGIARKHMRRLRRLTNI